MNIILIISAVVIAILGAIAAGFILLIGSSIFHAPKGKVIRDKQKEEADTPIAAPGQSPITMEGTEYV